MARDRLADDPGAMVHDLRTILDGWEYEPGKISVRKIIGCDGREKIQTRVDLGLLQLELTGRPDGQRPDGFPSMLDRCISRRRDHATQHGSTESYRLTADECRELRHEAHLVYQRFLSLFVLEDFDGVARDTDRNLQLFDLCRDHGANEHDRTALEPQRSYVIMMNTRANAYAASRAGRHEDAVRHVERGIQRISEVEAVTGDDTPAGEAPEMQVLEALRSELFQAMPADALPRVRYELQLALEDENYELAARLRDQLARLQSTDAA